MGKFQWDYMINCHENENGDKKYRHKDTWTHGHGHKHGHKYTKYSIPRQDHVYV